MAFDECVENPAAYDYAKDSCARTARWLRRCKAEMNRLNALPDTINPNQMLFGINQGCTYIDLRVNHMKEIAELGLDGYAIGGLAVGEPAEVMYEVIEAVEEHMPQDKIRYLMGVGTPTNILEAVHRGVDLFDCVMPAAMHAMAMHLQMKASQYCSMRNTRWTISRSTRPATARSAASFPVLIFTTFSKRGRCLPCA